jgi:hypothetical protein
LQFFCGPHIFEKKRKENVKEKEKNPVSRMLDENGRQLPGARRFRTGAGPSAVGAARPI